MTRNRLSFLSILSVAFFWEKNFYPKNKKSKAERLLMCTMVALTTLSAIGPLAAQRTVEVRVNRVFSNVCDLDGFLSGDSDPQWNYAINDGFGNNASDSYEASGTNNPQWLTRNTTFFSQTYGCTSPGTLSFDWEAFEDDGLTTEAGVNPGAVTSTVDNGQGSGNWFTIPFYQSVNGCCCPGGVTWRIEIAVRYIGNNIPAPGNNDICGATALTLNANTNGNNNCATVQAGEVDSPDGNVSPTNTVWYRFAAPVSGHVRVIVNETGMGDPEASLWYQSNGAACTFNTLQHVVSEDDDVAIFDLQVDMEATCLEPGATYFVQVDGDDAADVGGFNLQISSVGPPIGTNNAICNAIALTLGNTVSGNNNCATVQAGEVDSPDGNVSPSNTVWYYFTAPASGHVIVSTDFGGTDFDTEISLWQQTNGTACTFNTLVHAASDDDVLWPFDLDSELEAFCLTPGARYYVQVDGNDAPDQGNFQLQVSNAGGTIATNDLCANAINLGTLPFSGTLGNNNLSLYNNFCAGNAGDPAPGWGLDQNDQGVWFRFTTGPTPSTHITLAATNDPQGLGDQIDLQLALYQGGCGALSQIAEEYDAVVSTDEDMQVLCLLPNTTYHVLVDGGDFSFLFGNGQEGYFGLEIVDEGIAQPGDQICQATNLGTVPANGSIGTPPLSQSNICATTTGDPDPNAWDPDATVWYSFVAPPSGSVFIETNSDLPFPLGDDAIDLQLAVYDAAPNTCAGVLNEFDSEYDPGFSDEDMEVRCLTPGRRYWILVDGGGGIGGTEGIFDITLTDMQAPPAPNDLICNAVPIGAPLPNAPVSVFDQTDYCADNLFEPIPTNWGNDQGVWFTFVAPPSGEVNIYAENTGDDAIDLQLAVYNSADMTCTGALTELASDYDGLGLLTDEDLNVRCLEPGRTYYLLVDGNAAIFNPELLDGEFDITIEATNAAPPTANELPCQAVALGNPTNGPVFTGPGPGRPSQNNFCTDANGEPVPSGFSPDQTVWYTFLAPSTGSVSIQAVSDALLGDNPIDLQLAVFASQTNTCNGPFVEVGGDYDLPLFDEDLDVHCLEPNREYYLLVDGSGLNVEGYFDLTITEIPPLPVPANDALCAAVPLGNPFVAPVGINGEFNICATDFGDPDPDAFDTDQTVWYSFVTPATGGPFAVNVDAISDFPWPIGDDAVDLQIAVYESSNNLCNGTLNEMASDYDPGFFDETAEIQCLEPGRTYFVMIDGSALNVQGYFDLEIAPTTPLPIPLNDNRCQATNLGNLPAGGTLNTGTSYFNFCATVEPDEPTPGFGPDQTVWFTFTTPPNPNPLATANVTVRIESDPNNLGDGLDAQLAVYSGGPCNAAFLLLGESDNLLSFDAETELVCLTPGTQYWIQVDGSALNIEGYFGVEIQDDGFGLLPANDNVCNALNLGTVPDGGTIDDGINYTNRCATVEPAEPDPSAFDLDQTVWFLFFAPASGNVTISALSDPANLGDEIDLQVAVWDVPGGTCISPFLEHDSDYDFFSYDEDVTVTCLEPGMPYYIQVDGAENLFGGVEGFFQIEIDDDGGAPTVFPYNNDICNAFDFGTINGTPEVLPTENNDCANVEVGEAGLLDYAQHTVWYSFVAPASGRVLITVDGNQFLGGIDPEVHLLASSNDSCTGIMAELAESYIPGNGGFLEERIENTCLIPGERYFIQVDGTTVVGPMGDFTISIQDPEPVYGTGQPGDPEPANNECPDAQPLLVQDESCFIGSGTFELHNYGQPTVSLNNNFVQNCNPEGNCGDIWYTFTMPATGIALIEGNDDDINAPFPGFGDFSDLTIAAYTGGCNALSPLDCAAGGLGTDISYQVAAPPGTTVYVQVFEGGGNDNDEDFEICVSEACGADRCDMAVAVPILPNVPYCFETESAHGEDVVNGEPGYSECSQGQTGDNPERSVYFAFTTDCSGTALQVFILNATFQSSCVLGVPTDGFSISLFQDNTPCDNNPDVLVDCQTFDNCQGGTINWNNAYQNLQPNTQYIIQIEGGIGNFAGNVNGDLMIATAINPQLLAVADQPSCLGNPTGTATAQPQAGTGTPPFAYLWDNGETNQTATQLTPGTHTVTSTDVNGCTATASVSINAVASPTVLAGSTAPVCRGQSVQLQVDTLLPGATYLWIGPNGYNATGPYPDRDDMQPADAGTYTVTLTDANGCTATSAVNVALGSCPEICDNGIDDNGDGAVDEGCGCD